MDGFQERKWFVYQTDHHEGPFSLSEIQQRITAGEVQRTQYVWCEGMSDWVIMTSVRDFEALSVPAPQTELPSGPLDSTLSSTFSKDTLDFELNPAPAAEPASISLEIAPEVESQLEPQLESEPAIETESEAAAAEPEAEPAIQLEEPKAEAEAEMPVFESSLNSGSSGMEVPRNFGFLKVFLTLSIVGLGAYGYKSGRLDPVVKHPAFVKFITATRGVIQPGLSKLAQWVPPLQSVFSPIPEIEGVTAEELAEMRAAAQSKTPAQLGMAIYQDDLLAPTFYIGTNLPSGVSLDVKLIGVSDTLLSQLSLTTTTQAVVEDFVARVESLRQPDGRPLVQGQYQLVVTESEASKQSSGAGAALAALTDSKVLPPETSGITGPHKIVFVKSYFLGGPKDDTYAQRLKEFHDRMATKSTDELREIRQFATTLESQLKDSIRDYTKAKSIKNAKQATKGWNTFHDKWRRMQSQLEEAFAKWTDSIARGDYFHGTLYELTRSLGDQISQLHAGQHALVNGSGAPSVDEIGAKSVAAQDTLKALREKLDASEKLPRTESGMPQRLPPPVNVETPAK